MKKFALPLMMIASCLTFAACTDDEKEIKGNDTPNWIGSPCTCEGSGCKLMKIPLPAPTKDAVIKGCENVDMTGIEGGRLACLQTISKSFDTMAPPTYFPQGYCTISAVGCEGSSFCGQASYGEVEALTKCPEGTVMIDSTFDYPIVNQNSVITERLCAKACETDADCNVDGEMSCLNKNGFKFCYNEANYAFMGDDVKYTKF